MGQPKIDQIKRTALWHQHQALGAKMVEFGGWEMPVSYKGIIQEHMAVRKHAGLFDVSHMGRILVDGPEAEKFLDYLSTNRIVGKPPGSAIYTVLSSEKGGCVDDVIIYREGSQKFFVVVNASNREKDLEHFKSQAKAFNVAIQDRYQQDGILAIQGPQADAVIEPIFKEAAGIKPMHFAPSTYQGKDIILSRTGYTGERGFEIYAAQELIVELWKHLLERGQSAGIEPVGLGARDTLRLEMGYALYGHELSDQVSPNETVSAWTIKWDKPSFLGKEAMERLENSSQKRFEYGIMLKNKGIAREGCAVFKDNRQIGTVTSGTFSPSLSQAIAIILVQEKCKPGDTLDVQIRQNRVQGEVVSLPFYKEVNR